MADRAAIDALLARYADALRAGDADAAAACFTADAVVAAPGAPTASGAEVPALYGAILGSLRLDIAFEVDAVVAGADGSTVVFTTSTGTQTEVASGAATPEHNREAFVLSGDGDRPSIARYLFNVVE